MEWYCFMLFVLELKMATYGSDTLGGNSKLRLKNEFQNACNGRVEFKPWHQVCKVTNWGAKGRSGGDNWMRHSEGSRGDSVSGDSPE